MTDDPWLDEAEQTAWRSYVRMRRRLETHLAWHLQREFGLSAADFEILVNLSEAPTRRMRAFELGEATQWEKSRVSHQLRRMEQRGLVRKEACDARYPEVVLTEQGLDAITRCAPKHAANVRKLFVDVLGIDRLVALGQASEEVLRAVDDHERADGRPDPCAD